LPVTRDGLLGAGKCLFGDVGHQIDTDLGFDIGGHDIGRHHEYTGQLRVEISRQAESNFEAVAATNAVIQMDEDIFVFHRRSLNYG
jgi:hypothetical protein